MPGRLLIVAAVIIAGCRGAEPGPPPGGPRVDPASLPGRIALELWSLRPGISLGAWAPVNLNDQVLGADSQIPGIPAGWCARAVSELKAGERAIVRESYFYPPHPPANLSLPDSASDGMLLSCTLGLMRLSVPESKPPAVESIVGRLDSVFGPREGTRFEHNGLIIQVTWDDHLAAATVLARFPLRAAIRFSPLDTLPLDSLARAAWPDSARWAPLRRLLDDTMFGQPADLTGPLVRWVRLAEGLPGPRRAAALVAADAVLERAQCRFRLCEQDSDAALAPLRAAGAEFRWSPLARMLISSRRWLSQARIIDRDSPLGRQILLLQLEHAFDFTGTCDRGPDAFRAVISNGERYLERLPDSPVAPQVHFYLGEAYRDIVALAQGAGGDFADVSRYEAEAEDARALAIEHYRAAVAAGPSRTANAAWQQAWWLLSGLKPVGTRYYCIYE